jgi:hypothetical protein
MRKAMIDGGISLLTVAHGFQPIQHISEIVVARPARVGRRRVLGVHHFFVLIGACYERHLR